MKVHVKICGVRALDEALAAVDAGADMLGFNFYPPSPRYVEPSTCADLIAVLHRRGLSVTTVGVFVNAPVKAITAILDECSLDLAQLSGDEPPALVEALGARAFKAVRPQTTEAARAALDRYPRRATPPALLIDTAHRGAYGGTGQTGNWALARWLATRAPIMLAGGLHPENVTGALRQVRPWGVDVASGVESEPGRKDPAKIVAFVRAVRAFEQESSA